MRCDFRKFVVLMLSLAFASCGEEGQRPVETIVVCVWDSVDARELEENLDSKTFAAVSALSKLAVRAGGAKDFYPQTNRASSAFASILTQLPVADHGLRSMRELGAQTIRHSVETLAEELKGRGYRTLASVSEAHFQLGDLDRGCDTWHAPERREPRTWRTSREVFGALESDLRAALGSDDPVFVVLHFGDLRGNRWRDVEPSRELLEAHFKSWRGKDAEVDGAFDTKEESRTLAERLRRALMRRTDDPRREALEHALYAGALAQLDTQLAGVMLAIEDSRRAEKAIVLVCGGPAGLELHGSALGARARSKYVHVGATSPPSTWIASLTEDLSALDSEPSTDSPHFAAPQGIQIASESPLFAGLRATVTCEDSTVQVFAKGDNNAPTKHSVQVRFDSEPVQLLEFSRRGEVFIVRFKHDKLREVSANDLVVGSKTLAQSDVPELIASQSPSWPADATDAPVLDLQTAYGRRISGRIAVDEGAAVELLIELFPPNRKLASEIKCETATVGAHPLRPGAVWLRGMGPFDFELPPGSPSDRIGVVLRVNGERVAGARMRYLKRAFTAPDTIELGFSAGAWLAENLRAELPMAATRSIALRLLDELPLRDDIRLPAPGALEYLQLLDENE